MSLGADFRRRLEQVLACPTAPFHEGRVHAVLRDAVAASPRLRGRTDDHGNLEVVYGKGRPKLLFACHTDHPALVSNGDGTATIRGGIRPEALVGAGLRTFDEDGPRPTVTGVAKKKPPAKVKLKGARGIRRGTPLVLDLPAYRITKTRVRARAVDDLVAVSACLAMFDRLEKARWDGTVGALFTRAEEVGFAGALAWSRTTRYPKSTTVVNLEMSSARPHTPQGDGPILRVGDRITTFAPGVSIELEDTALALKKRDEEFRYQRALMDGGACEATAYALAGFRAGALCLPLKNYHNHAGKGVGLEYVAAADAENLVRWMTAYARGFGRQEPGRRVVARLDKLWRKHRRALERTAEQGEGVDG
jgi:endoglucanase